MTAAPRWTPRGLLQIPTRHRKVGLAALVATAALAAVPVLVAQAAAPPPPPPAIAGMTFAYTPPWTGDRPEGARLTISLTSARTLTARCSTARKLVVNGTTTAYSCATLQWLTINGSAGADRVDVQIGSEQRTQVRAQLGAGNDVAKVIASDPAIIDGGTGDDTLSTALWVAASGWIDDAPGQLTGGAGTDTLTNLGYVGPGTPPATFADQAHPIDYWGLRLDGGAGADRIVGGSVRPDLVTMDLTDTVTFNGGEGRATLVASSGPDTIFVQNNGNYGTKVAITTAGTTRNWVFPTKQSFLVVDAGAGDDRITVDHRSKGTDLWISGGAGYDQLTINPSVAGYTEDKFGVYQPGWRSISYDGGVELTTIKLILRP